MVMQCACEPGYILHSRPYRDTSLILEVFSEVHGRLGMVARGARSARSRQRGLLQPFQPLLLSWSARGELATLTAVETYGGMLPLRGNGLFSGFYVNELLVRLLHRNDPYPELFDEYSRLLPQLVLPEGLEIVLRTFEIRLLELLGYGLQLSHEAASDAPLAADGVYDYQLLRGPVRLQGDRVSGVKIGGSSLLAMGVYALEDEQVRGDAKRLTRAALDQQLGKRPLKTREVMRQLARTTRREV